ncbi:MAG: aminotransferase class I/II-fold pyridoxal phosphate-dependent enzyme, partial [Candidatus Aminicenantes bacterium]|nr:aminotransferase class I/II-fold pyridoxal phosphate-dependent enzyme [Candidatus Aminicenantes bacterium]
MNIPGKTMAGVMEAPIPKIMGPASGRRDVLSFAQGLPWFGPPSAALTRTLERLRNGEGDGYSDDSGRGSLRELAASDLQKRGLAGIKPANILLTPGANQAVFIALSVLADPGDEVILFRPYYFNNLMALQMLGLKPVIVE